MRKILAAILCMALLTTSAYAANLTSVDINQVFQNGEELYVAFHANDENGEAMSTLTGESIRLEVGGEILETELLNQDALGMGYVFAVDVSASLTSEQFAAVREQMKSWAASLGEQDSMAIVTFGNNVTTVADFTANINTLNAIIDGLQPVDATTMLYSGVLRAVDLATRQGENLPGRRAVVLLSDGMNDTTVGAVGIQEVKDKAVEAGVPLYVAGVVGDGNADSLAAMGGLARATGGVIYTGNKDELGQCFERLGTYIGSGYLIKAAVSAEEADSSQKGLILTVTSGGISAADSANLRLRATVDSSAPADEELQPTQELTEEGLSEEALLEQALLEQALLEQGLFEEGMPEEGMPEEGLPEEGLPEEGIPEEGMPEEGLPEEGLPEEGLPEEGLPEEGLPEEGLPEEGLPEEGLPEEQTPQEQQEVETSTEPLGVEGTAAPATDTPRVNDGNFLEEYGLYVYIGCGVLLVALISCCIAIPMAKKKKAKKDSNKLEQQCNETGDLPTIIDSVGGGGRLVLTDTVMSQSYSCALKDRISIGRRDDNDIVIRDSRVSGTHCELIRDNGRMYVRDTGSRNGTRVIVNGVRYQVDGISGQEVQVGDEIEIGHTRLELAEV